MNSIIFQVGLLAFFVAAVLFGIQGMPVLDTIARSFVVFIAAVTGQAALVMVIGSMRKHQEPPSAQQPRRESQEPGGQGESASSSQTAPGAL